MQKARKEKKENLLLVKMKEKLLKIQPLPKVLCVQAIRSKQLRNMYITATYTGVCKIIAQRATVSNGLFFILLVGNVKKGTLSANMRHCTVMKRLLDEQLFCIRQAVLSEKRTLLLVKMKVKKLLKIQPLPNVRWR